MITFIAVRTSSTWYVAQHFGDYYETIATVGPDPSDEDFGPNGTRARFMALAMNGGQATAEGSE